MGTLLSLTLLALSLMWFVLAFSTDSFGLITISPNLLRQGSMIAIWQWARLVIITAGIDLSVGAVVGFASVIVAWLLAQVPDLGLDHHHARVRLRHWRFPASESKTRLAAHHDVGFADGAARCRSAHHKWRHHFNHQ
jgi:ribose/xylose/arabinose/galactoside ABC-type transport system permease subunit